MNVVEDIDRGWKNLKADMKRLNNSYTKVGVQQGELHKSEDGEISDLVKIAAQNEFGTRHIPSRPFMRNAFSKNRLKLSVLQDKLIYKMIHNEISPRRALSIMGEFMTNKVKLEIKTLKTPPNAPSTIKKKTVGGKIGDNPLIDQGHLVQSITHTEFIA